jgi:uncharacterized repeat protein (TIGR01451 family)
LYGSAPIGSQINLAIDEETAAGDNTRTHIDEQVAYWVFDPYPNMSISKTSCVINDPVNGNTNPKRIPGATIRYAMEVNNTGYRQAEDVLVDDNLSSEFDASTIRYLQIQNGVCDCTGVSSANNNGTHGSGNGVNPVKLDYDTVARGTPRSPTTECGYFEVQIR